MSDYIFICLKAKRGIQSHRIAVTCILKSGKNIAAAQKTASSFRILKPAYRQLQRQNVFGSLLNGALLKLKSLAASFTSAMCMLCVMIGKSMGNKQPKKKKILMANYKGL
jgi:hypothetical protein